MVNLLRQHESLLPSISISRVDSNTYYDQLYMKCYEVCQLSWITYGRSDGRRGPLTRAREKGEGEGVFREVRKWAWRITPMKGREIGKY